MALGMFESFTSRHWFSGAARRLWDDRAQLQAWLDVEATLAEVQAGLGLVPAEAAERIRAMARSDLFDLGVLSEAIAGAQHPLVPVLHQLEALCREPAAGYIHWGATTQNIFDTATALQMKPTHRLIVDELDRALTSLRNLAMAHRDTPMAGRTHGQHALPMTLGFKLAGWIDELDRHHRRLEDRFAESFPACMGGAIGSFAAMGTQGPEVERQLAERLGLQAAGLPMRASFDRAADYLGTLGLLAATAQKIAQDIVFLQRTEVGELSEAFHTGKVGSSTMAQKRNPSTAQLLASLARLLRSRVPLALESMVRLDEGDSAATNVTDVMVPEAALLATAVVETLARLVAGLQVHADAAGRNLDLTNGLIASEAAMMRLSPIIGRHAAHRLLYEAAQRCHDSGRTLAIELREHPALAGRADLPELGSALEPRHYLGECAALTTVTVARAERPA